MVLLNTLQTVSQRHSSNQYNEQQESVSVSYESQESFSSFIMQEAIKQDTIFQAMRLVYEVQQLNGGKHLSNFDLVNIKKHFSNNKVVNKGSNKNDNINNKKGFTQKHFTDNKVESNQTLYDSLSSSSNEITKSQLSKGKRTKGDSIQRKLQKGYMSMLSNQM